MLFKKLSSSTLFIGWLAAFFLISTSMSSQAAPTVSFNSLRSGCASTLSSEIHGNKFVGRKSLSISAININIGNGTQSNFSTSKYYIMSDNTLTNNPLSVLETFTPDAISLSGANTLARFVGNFTVTPGSKFWIIPAQSHSLLPICYSGGGTTSNITMDGITLDTSTSLSNSSFRRAFNNTTNSPINAPWGTSFDDGVVFQLTIETTVFVSAPVSITVSLTSGGSTAIYKSETSLKATVGSPSKVTFYANNKVIPLCRNLMSSGGYAYCNWKPSVHGSQYIKAKAVPTDGTTLEGTSTPVTVGIATRTSKR